MDYTKYFSGVVTTTLVVLSATLHSASFAYAAVFALVLTLGKEAFDRYIDSKTLKNTIPEETKKRMQDMEARVTTIELGIQRRGF